MPTFFILATTDAALADAWERQLPPGRVALRLGNHVFPGGEAPSFAAVVILDAIAESVLPPALARCPTIYVGEPRSLPFEQARMACRARIYLSYQESTTRLKELLPLVEEVAEKQSMVELLQDKARRGGARQPGPRPPVAAGLETWDFFASALENFEVKDRLLEEFRRATRHALRASQAIFFLREADGFRADRGGGFFPVDDPLVGFFEAHPVVIDAMNWDGDHAEPVAVLAIRNRLALWGARLLVPLHENGWLMGLMALGVREDGLVYDEADQARAVALARLLRQFLAKSAQAARLSEVADRMALGAKYLPGTLVLGPDEEAPRHVPLVVRDLVGQVLHSRKICRVMPTPRQPFRACAGPIEETGGVWAYWEDATEEVHESELRERAGRREILRELALTLSHELGNALVSLTTFRQAAGERPLPTSMIETIKADVANLEALNSNLAVMQGLHEAKSEKVDVRELVQHVCSSLGLRVELGQEPVALAICGKLMTFALRALLRTVGENRGERGLRELALKLRTTGTGPGLTVLLSLKGEAIELEGILPEPVDGAAPSQGRLGVLLAKEILRLHHGEIHAGPGMEGTEILISFRKL